ncbi:MAG: hypothetical protein ACE5F8_08930, partial [Woeseiaceae bacterium]
DACDAYYARFGEDAELHAWQGISHFMLGDATLARLHLKRSMELFDDTVNPYVWIHAILVSARENRNAEAGTLCDELRTYLDGVSPWDSANIRMETHSILAHLACENTAGALKEIDARLALEMPAFEMGTIAAALAISGDTHRASQVLMEHAGRTSAITLFRYIIHLAAADTVLDNPEFVRAFQAVEHRREDLSARY